MPVHLLTAEGDGPDTATGSNRIGAVLDFLAGVSLHESPPAWSTLFGDDETAATAVVTGRTSRFELAEITSAGPVSAVVQINQRPPALTNLSSGTRVLNARTSLEFAGLWNRQVA
jgi:hypothetical protein